jgi:hypothetical protein
MIIQLSEAVFGDLVKPHNNVILGYYQGQSHRAWNPSQIRHTSQMNIQLSMLNVKVKS